MFYFQELLQRGLAGIDSTAMIPTVIGIGYSILLVGFLVGLYQSAMRGGDLQSLAVSAIKYVVVAIVLANWSAAFHQVNDSFCQVAQFIASNSGAGDMFLSWMDQLKQQLSNAGMAALLPAISGTMAAIVTALLTLAAYLIYAVMVVVFAFFYVLYGCSLYVVGPMVLALLPMAGIGQLAKSYATNLMIWNAWGILYAAFGALITAIQFNRVDQVISQGFLNGFFQGSADSTILGLVSVFYALALGLIPLIARRLISGDAGSSVYALVRAGAAAAGVVNSGVSGFAAGASSGGPQLGAATASSGGRSAASVACSSPPPQPGFAETIRSGVMSAMSAPASPPSSPAGDTGGPAARPISGMDSRARGSSPSGWFRPSGVTQTLAFHAARSAGSFFGGAGEGSRERGERR